MKYYNSIINTIGNTPLVKLNNVNKGIKGTILVKLEYFNPGNSMKDRMAVRMIEDAEKSGKLKSGGTIIEGTAGNTGMGLALVANLKGYKCIFTLADKQSSEKIDILRSVGAEVHVCPTNVNPEDSKSYYSVAKKLNDDIPNSFYANQYDNESNTLAHYESTGPEIWRDTEGKITHYAATVGTGGSISGVAKYLKEQNPDIISIGLDSYGSVFKKYKETGIFDKNEIYPYLIEGIGEDILPKNVNFDLIDSFIKVTDKDSAIMARRLAREEGMFIGWSSGAAVHGALEYAKEHLKEDDIMVIIMPDHGTRYLGKIYNDNWMKDHGFTDSGINVTALDIIRNKKETDDLFTITSSTTIGDAIRLMNEKGIDQTPVVKDDEFVGSISDNKLLSSLIKNPKLKNEPIAQIMAPSFRFVAMDTTVDVLSSFINKDNKALLIREDKNVHIITQTDLLMSLTN